jgi:hypothetical protein
LAPFLQNHTVWLGCSSHVGKTDASAPAPHLLLQTLRFHEQTLPMYTLFPQLEAADSRGAWLTTRQLAQTHQWPLTMIERLDTPGLLGVRFKVMWSYSRAIHATKEPRHGRTVNERCAIGKKIGRTS